MDFLLRNSVLVLYFGIFRHPCYKFVIFFNLLYKRDLYIEYNDLSLRMIVWEDTASLPFILRNHVLTWYPQKLSPICQPWNKMVNNKFYSVGTTTVFPIHSYWAFKPSCYVKETKRFQFVDFEAIELIVQDFVFCLISSSVSNLSRLKNKRKHVTMCYRVCDIEVTYSWE